jgi:spermidine/putrescine transport system permease protein
MIDSGQVNDAELRYAPPLSRAGHWLRSAMTSGPAALWLILFLLVPLLIIAGVSFLTRGPYGELEWPLTLDSYKRLLGFGELGFDPLYPAILLRSLALGAATAGLCVLMALPLSFFIARLPARFKPLANPVGAGKLAHPRGALAGARREG